MKQKKAETLLYSAIGVLVMFAIIVGVNLIFGAVRARVDMTSDRIHTLDEGTKKILKSIDTPIEIRFYCSQGQDRMPAGLKPFAQNVDDMLAEFKAQNPKNIELKKFDPRPDSEDEDLARLDGIEARQLPNGEALYMGVAISLDPQKVAIPYVSPERERLLEYDLARAITRVLTTTKPVIGVMSPLPLNGMQLPPQMMMQMRQRGQDPWIVMTELKKDFDVQTVGMDVESIDDKIKVLLVVHPKNISDKAQFAIDQFVLRGGKLIAFLDPLCLVDKSGQNPQFGGMQMGGGSSLPKLLKAWGLEFDSGKVVADLNFLKTISDESGRERIEPAWLWLDPRAIDRKDAIMSQFDNLLLPAAGVFTGTPATGLKMDTLLKTSTDSQLIDSFMAQGGGRKVLDELKAGGKEMSLAVRLTGKFKSAFPEGKPADEAKADEKKDEKAEKPKDDSLKEAKAENAVYLIGDADMMYDHFCVQVRRQFIFNVVQPFNGNLTFVQSLVEQMSGDSNLIGVRSRASIRRPFEVVDKMRAEANKKFQAEIARFEKEAQEAQQKIGEIMSKKEGNQRFILPPEARKELENLNKKQADANKQLRVLRRELRNDEEVLQSWLRVINIGIMPLAVAIAGVALAVVRKRKTGAK